MQRSSISALIVYLGVVGAMLLSIGVALAVVTGSVIQQQHADRGVTPFERQLQSSRSTGSACETHSTSAAAASREGKRA
jgi:hypothetical protein